jgi:nitroimidazol reductase NimA-like FMN-containing flavoprotein (pyridoxamine 5'-phosphate oxidase superfamily)
MAKIAEHLKMSESEVNDLMSRERHVRIATLGPGSEINLTPMTFGWAGGCAYIFARGQKIANLRRRPETTLLVDTGERWRELKGVMISGRAIVLEDRYAEAADPHLLEARLNIGAKHGLQDEQGNVLPHGASASGRSRRWIVFSPERFVSWDNARLENSPGS